MVVAPSTGAELITLRETFRKLKNGTLNPKPFGKSTGCGASRLWLEPEQSGGSLHGW